MSGSFDLSHFVFYKKKVGGGGEGGCGSLFSTTPSQNAHPCGGRSIVRKRVGRKFV